MSSRVYLKRTSERLVFIPNLDPSKHRLRHFQSRNYKPYNMTLKEKVESTVIDEPVSNLSKRCLNISKGDMREEILGGNDVSSTVQKTATTIPEITVSVFASPEARGVLRTMTDGEQEERSQNLEDNSEEASGDKNRIRKYGRWQQAQQHFLKDRKSISFRREPLSCRRRSEGGINTVMSTENLGKFSPVPPKSQPPRRTSLSSLNPHRRLTSPSRIRFSPDSNMGGKTTSFENINTKTFDMLTPSSSSWQSRRSSSSLSSSSSSSSSSSCEASSLGGNMMRCQARRRFSLPVSHRIHIASLHHPQKPSSSTTGSSTSPTAVAARSISPRSSITSLQMNREKLENLIKERSKVISNLTIGSSTEHAERSSPRKDKEETFIRRPSLIRSLSPSSAISSLETVSDLNTGRPINDDITATHYTNNIMEKADSHQDTSSPTHRIAESPRLPDDFAVTKSRRSSLCSDISNFRHHRALPSVKMSIDNGLSVTSGLYNRRRSAPILDGVTWSASSLGDCRTMKTVNRCDDEIVNDLEEELQRRILQRKNQLLMQAASGSSSGSSAVTRLEARANCRTTNMRLRKIMNNLTMERTTAQLLSMRQALVAS